jgi:hypothetical protein
MIFFGRAFIFPLTVGQNDSLAALGCRQFAAVETRDSEDRKNAAQYQYDLDKSPAQF